MIVIPDCTEAIAFYTKIVTTAQIGVGEQIQSLKSVVAHILLVVVVIKVTLIKFWNRTEEDLLHNGESCLCNRCLQKEQEREILEGLLVSEHIWLHKFKKKKKKYSL